MNCFQGKFPCDPILINTSLFSFPLSLFLLSSGYYFNETGLLICEPFYSKPSYRILATCSLYFPTTMILMYCYGSSFHASRLRLVTATPSTMMQQTRSIVASQTATVTRPIAVAGNTILPSPTEKVNTYKYCSIHWIADEIILENLIRITQCYK